MNHRALTSLALLAFAAACGEQPSPTGLVAEAPSYGKASSDAGIAERFDDDAGRKIVSDGRSAKILNVLTAASYANAQCGVSSTLNLGDAVATLATSLTKTQKSTCWDDLGTGRLLRFTLDAPVNAGDPAFSTVAAPYHMKINDVQIITSSGYVNGGWGRVSSRDPIVGDCEKIRFSTEHGSDPLLVTRTKTKGVDGSDRNEWTVETAPDADRAACLNADLVVLRYYHLPVKLTVTQVTY